MTAQPTLSHCLPLQLPGLKRKPSHSCYLSISRSAFLSLSSPLPPPLSLFFSFSLSLSHCGGLQRSPSSDWPLCNELNPFLFLDEGGGRYFLLFLTPTALPAPETSSIRVSAFHLWNLLHLFDPVKIKIKQNIHIVAIFFSNKPTNQCSYNLLISLLHVVFYIFTPTKE